MSNGISGSGVTGTTGQHDNSTQGTEGFDPNAHGDTLDDTFGTMIEWQAKMQVFSMNVNMASAAHQAKQSAIQNINR